MKDISEFLRKISSICHNTALMAPAQGEVTAYLCRVAQTLPWGDKLCRKDKGSSNLYGKIRTQRENCSLNLRIFNYLLWGSLDTKIKLCSSLWLCSVVIEVKSSIPIDWRYAIMSLDCLRGKPSIFTLLKKEFTIPFQD